MRLPSAALPASACAAALFAACGSPAPAPVAPTPVAAVPVTDESRIDAVRAYAADEPARAAAALKAMHTDAMSVDDRQAWARLARTVAVRTGDRAWLGAIEDPQDPFSQVVMYRVLLAGSHVEEGDFRAAEAELARVEDIDHVNPRDRRRYWALHARMAQMRGDAVAERHAIETIVDELQFWPNARCQTCHDDRRRPGTVTQLDVRGRWFVTRYAEILRRDGDAARVRAEAERALAVDPKDNAARLQLAFALMAQGDAAGADARIAEIPWAEAPGREPMPARMVMPYP